MMKIESKRIVETAGVTSVVLSLLFVAFELRQANTIARIEAETAVMNNFANASELLVVDSNLRAVIVKLKDGYSALTEDEAFVARSWVRRLLTAWVTIETSFENGMLSRETFDLAFNDLRRNMELPGFRVALETEIEAYPAWSNTEIFKFAKERLQQYRAE